MSWIAVGIGGASAAASLASSASSGKGGGGQAVNTSQFTNMGPWQPQQKHLQNVFGNAEHLYANGKPQYHKSVLPFSGEQDLWMNNFAGQAGGAMPLGNDALNQTRATINGQYLDPNSNPWLRGTFDNASNAVTRAFSNTTAPTTDAMFAQAGRFGSGARFNAVNQNEQNLGETLNKLANDIYGGNYQMERGRQFDATNNFGNVVQQSLVAPQAALGIADRRQGQAERALADDNAMLQYSEGLGDWQNLARYKAMIDGSYGQYGMGSGQQPGMSGGSPIAQGLGGLFTGASIAGQLGWRPFSGSGSGGGGSGWTY